MGINRLTDGVLKGRYEPIWLPLYKFSGWRIAIDSSILIHRNKNKIRSNLADKLENIFNKQKMVGRKRFEFV